MKYTRITSRFGFTLLEVLVVVTISAMILAAVMAIYGQVRGNAAVLMSRLGENRLTDEILQKIAEDIDRLAAPGFDAQIQFTNKATTGNLRSAQLVLTSGYYGNANRKETYEEIIWQTWYDPGAGTMVLYRMHDGINVEDRMLQGTAEESASAGMYVPVAAGVTFFELRVQKGETIYSSWNSEKLPNAVQIGLSFELPQELVDGTVGVPIEDISYRTVAIDRTRMIPYQFIKRDLDLSSLDEEPTDPNDMTDETGSTDSDEEEPDEDSEDLNPEDMIE